MVIQAWDGAETNEGMLFGGRETPVNRGQFVCKNW